MRKTSSAGSRAAIIRITAAAAAAGILLMPGPLAAQAKRLQVIVDRAEVHLEAGEGSPVMATLPAGETVTLAAALKARQSWYYVYFVSAGSRATRAGYIRDDAVRKLFPEARIIDICVEGEIARPAEFLLDDQAAPPFAWDMDRETLLRSAGRPISQSRAEEGEILRYKQPVLGKHCLVEYLFAGDGLAAVRCHLLENYADKNRYIDDFTAIKEYLVRRLGEPRQDLVTWQDESYRNDSGLWGRALLLGHLEYRTQWVFNGTEVLVVLAGDGSGVSFGAECTNLKARTASF